MTKIIIAFLQCQLNLFLFMLSFSNGIGEKLGQTGAEGECRGNLQSPRNLGDCNPDHCGILGRTCEARYARFWDQTAKVDRTLRSCRCLRKPICPLMGKVGCQHYGTLEKHAQTLVRKWTSNEEERRSRVGMRMAGRKEERVWRNGNMSIIHYSDAQRHDALMEGNSQFCCRISTLPFVGSHKPFLPMNSRSRSLVEKHSSESFTTNHILFILSISIFPLFLPLLI